MVECNVFRLTDYMHHDPLIFYLHRETKKQMEYPRDTHLWQDWKTVEFKEYPRMPQIPLPKPHNLAPSLDKVLIKRSSKRNFTPKSTLALQDISTLLHWSAGISRGKKVPEKSRRFYPSSGARYPLELYLSIRGNKELETGVYHYNVRKHILEKINGEEADDKLRNLYGSPWINNTAIVIFITALFERNIKKYGEHSYRFVLIETGALLQNFYLVAESLSLGCCGLGAIPYDVPRHILDLDMEQEYPQIGLVIGQPL